MSFSSVETALKDIRGAVVAACPAEASPPEIVAISKMHPGEKVRAALAAGHRVFGENRVQEAAEKFPPLRESYPDLTLHLVGPLQTNKAGPAAELFDVIHSLDREKLVRKLAAALRESGRRMDGFIQVNTGEEPQKAGLAPPEVDDFLAFCREEAGDVLPVRGLMCIPPLDEPPALHFALLADMAARLGLDRLSMGMSGDWETALRYGATHLRLGTAIFGPRPASA